MASGYSWIDSVQLNAGASAAVNPYVSEASPFKGGNITFNNTPPIIYIVGGVIVLILGLKFFKKKK